MEYMAAGKPSIVTDGGGSRELVLDGHTGFLVSASNPQAVAARIELLLNSSDLGKQMGRAGQARLFDKFSLEQLVENTMRMYRETVWVGR